MRVLARVAFCEAIGDGLTAMKDPLTYLNLDVSSNRLGAGGVWVLAEQISSLAGLTTLEFHVDENKVKRQNARRP